MKENISELSIESKSNSDLEFILLNDYQKKFPLTERPFLTIAKELGQSEECIIGIYQKLFNEGRISRIGPIFAPGVFGVSTLAAMKVSRENLDHIADIVSSFPEVNHNYERNHEMNLWFVVMAQNKLKLDQVIELIEKQTQHQVFAFPLEKEFKIDLGFSMRGRE